VKKKPAARRVPAAEGEAVAEVAEAVEVAAPAVAEPAVAEDLESPADIRQFTATRPTGRRRGEPGEAEAE
jgi:hypothetical protein